MNSTTGRAYGLTAQFDSEEKLVEAARIVFCQGYRKIDAFSPYPIEGLAEIIGQKRSAAPLIMLIGGVIGAVTGYCARRRKNPANPAVRESDKEWARFYRENA